MAILSAKSYLDKVINKPQLENELIYDFTYR